MIHYFFFCRGPVANRTFIQAQSEVLDVLDNDNHEKILEILFYACGLYNTWGQIEAYNVSGSPLSDASLEELKQALISMHKENEASKKHLSILGTLMIKFNDLEASNNIKRFLLIYLLKYREHVLCDFISELSEIAIGYERFPKSLETEINKVLRLCHRSPVDVENFMSTLLKFINQDCRLQDQQGLSDDSNDRFAKLNQLIKDFRSVAGRIQTLNECFPDVEGHICQTISMNYTIEEQLNITTPACSLDCEVLRAEYAASFYSVETKLWSLLESNCNAILYWEAHFLRDKQVCLVKWATNVLECFNMINGCSFQEKITSTFKCKYVLRLPIFSMQEMLKYVQSSAQTAKPNEKRRLDNLKNGLITAKSEICQNSWPVQFFCRVNPYITKAGSSVSFILSSSTLTEQFNEMFQALSPDCRKQMYTNLHGILTADASKYLHIATELIESIPDLYSINEWDPDVTDRLQASFDVYANFPNTMRSTVGLASSWIAQDKPKLDSRRIRRVSTRGVIMLCHLIGNKQVLDDILRERTDYMTDPSKLLAGSETWDEAHTFAGQSSGDQQASRPRIRTRRRRVASELEGVEDASEDEDDDSSSKDDEAVKMTLNPVADDNSWDDENAEDLPHAGSAEQGSKYTIELLNALKEHHVMRYLQVDFINTELEVRGMIFMALFPDVKQASQGSTIKSQPVSVTFGSVGPPNSECQLCFCTCERFTLHADMQSFAATSTFFLGELVHLYAVDKFSTSCCHVYFASRMLFSNMKEIVTTNLQFVPSDQMTGNVYICQGLASLCHGMSTMFTMNHGKIILESHRFRNIVEVNFSKTIAHGWFLSVDVEPSMSVKRHGTVKVSQSVHFRYKTNKSSQITCLTCGSMFLSASSKRCRHVAAVAKREDSSKVHTPKKRSKYRHSAEDWFDTSLANKYLESSDGQPQSGYRIAGKTLSERCHEFDIGYEAGKLLFGGSPELRNTMHYQAEYLSSSKTKVFMDQTRPAYFEVGCDFLKGKPSTVCSLCQSHHDIIGKFRDVQVLTACNAIVHVKDAQYNYCTNCKLNLYDDGEHDGIWYITSKSALHLKHVYDCLSDFYHGRSRNFRSFWEGRDEAVRARMGGNAFCKYISRESFTLCFFKVLEYAILDLRTPCPGHLLDFLGPPDSAKHKDIRIWYQKGRCFPQLYDVANIGFDGISDVLGARPKPLHAPCSCQREPAKVLSLAHDRCPIMTANTTGNVSGIARTAANPAPGDRAISADIRSLLQEFSNIVQSLSTKTVTDEMKSNLTVQGHKLRAKLMQLDYAKSLCHMVTLFSNSGNPDKLQIALGSERFAMFISCCADVLHGCGGTVSVFSFIKPFVVGKCMEVCNYFMPDTIESADIPLHARRQQLKDFCSSLMPTPDRYPTATCVFYLASYLDLDSDKNEIRDEINIAVASTLIFLCSRVCYVMAIFEKKHPNDCFIGPLQKDDKPCGNCFAEYNPPATRGFFHFTCHGNQIRVCDSVDSVDSHRTGASSTLLAHDCKDKPSFLENEKSAKRKNLCSLLTVLCMKCNMFLGAGEIGTLGGANRYGESWRDVHNVMHMFKPSSAASVTYDNACA